MNTLALLDAARERARAARRQAEYLRELHGIATCGLPMKFTGYHYGNHEVEQAVAMRVADLYPVWAAEYDAIAASIEAQIEEVVATFSEIGDWRVEQGTYRSPGPDASTTVYACPECAQGKPWNCTGWALDDRDEMVQCERPNVGEPE